MEETTQSPPVPFLTKRMASIMAIIFLCGFLVGVIFAKNTIFNPESKKTYVVPTATPYLTPSETSPTQTPPTQTPIPTLGSVKKSCITADDCSGLPCRDGYCMSLDYNMEQTRDSACPSGTVKVCQAAICQCLAN